ncbi:uracil-xanthine permease family protein [Deinococcus soli (ex Cha et al. 2016)]|uniref:Uracil permease n=2 Tax=Deinococcus soli (ex Cha et al. 2016) TaxID=1309411 RepID=A0ACC6KLF5_9DEIO|nr:uracil-xanthine permease family protein [Deinococcus soli (ex Cha et al. 2016)]MDR6220477.1 uracil permease [Deinococcus soli (ex Cha et al. 2016)]MDR6330437.1 uracil permease [Deinococcus soli (ex Cha et al. 2016)]MDR6753279.1 uracil permease [Deinococcus soli (ex Cha et al. 2016)]
MTLTPTRPSARQIVLGLQHSIAMFGATVLVPILVGLSPSVALFGAGVATLLFHLLTRGQVPIFLGSSFAFIAPTALVVKEFGPAAAGGGLIAAGAMYLLFSGLVKLLGVGRLLRVFPPVVTGPVIIVIGLGLSSVAVNQAKTNWWLALVALAAAVIASLWGRGLFRMLPILIGVVTGYVVSLLTGQVTQDGLNAIAAAPLLGLPDFHAPTLDWRAVAIIAPVAVVTFIEHVGDVIVNGRVVGKNFLEKPGLSRTLFADGLANMSSAALGGPAATTYAENTGVLALTRVYDPRVLQIGAVFAVLFGCSPKLAAVLKSLPQGVLGGVSILLFGMIASVGIRTLSEARIDFAHSRNLIIVSLILVLGLGGAAFPISVAGTSLELHGMALAALVGIVANLILPAQTPETDEPERTLH